MRSPLEQIFYNFLIENNFNFQEQVNVGSYVADFIIILKSGLMDLEIDGMQHINRKEHDNKRDEYFKSKGYNVFRAKCSWKNRNKKKEKSRIEKYKKDLLKELK